MVRMHCNREVTHLPGTGTHIVRYCTVCDTTFKQRVTDKKRKLAPITSITTKTLIDLKTGKPITL